ncbi:MAG TPA: hypothetical protein VJH20_05690 [Candidatus Nanoarchaeia archaeon]|nr:hypothetical protein [Candidatus Nanoarchaeia archaeon]
MNKNIQLEDEYNSFIDFNSKLKSLESKYNLSRDRLFVINQNMIDQYKITSSELRFVKDELKNMKTDINAVKEALTEISRELSKFVKKEEVKVIEKYVSLWDPLKFVTEDQLKEYLNKNGNRKK